jgi:iron(III) transport system ATP-binding protein
MIPAVQLKSVSKKYGDVVAVDSIDLDIAEGELVTLLGPSGCGKTTTLRMMAGLEMCTGGQILLGGEDVTTLPATRRDVSMVFQSYALFPHLSVMENVAYGLRASGLAKAEAFDRAQEGLRLVDLDGYGARLPGALSGGQQQRVAVARALVLEPKVLLFDEPLSNLDARLRRKMREDIRQLQRKVGFTAVYVTHDQEEALAVSDRVVLMDRAKIAQQGTPREMYEAPRTEFAARFIGDSNIVDVEVLSLDGDRAQVQLGSLQLSLRNPGLSVGPAKLAVRPHGLSFSEVGEVVRILSATYLGDHMEYQAQGRMGELFIVAPHTQAPLAVDQEVHVQVDPEASALVV